MSQSTIQQRSSDSAQELGDETFMSATELRNYMMETMMAKASKDAGSGRAEKARDDLIKSLMQPVAVTPEKIAEVKRRVLGQLRTAAEKGNKEALVMRFPNALCTDKGRALNNFGKRLAEHPDRKAASGVRVLARPPAAPGLRPEGNDRGLAAGPSGRCRLFPYLGRREALTAGGETDV